jgi:hypothetical protein
MAVREFQTGPSIAGKSGPPLRADYVLLVARKAVGVVKAKTRGMTLCGVFEQLVRYMNSFPDEAC